MAVQWPEVGTRVVVWVERTPSTAPREPRACVVDHVAGPTFTVTGIEATFNRTTGRSRPVRCSAGAFGAETYVAVDAGSDRAREVLGAAVRSEQVADAVAAVQAWLAERSEPTRRRAVAALQALDPAADPDSSP